jgi:PAS domain S-box-containing protein
LQISYKDMTDIFPLAYYKEIIEQSVDIVTVMQPDGHVLYESPSLKQILGYMPGELRNGNLLPYIHASDIPNVQRLISEGLAHSENTYLLKLRFKHADGSWKQLECSARFIVLDGQHVIVVRSRDISDQTQNESKLEKISRAVEQSPDSIVITDKDGNIEYVNPFFCQNTGYSTDEVVGKNPRILKSGETNTLVYEELWKTISAGTIWRGELKNKKKNGELYWESISISPIVNKQGAITSYVAVKVDITRQKSQDEIFKKRSEELERMNALMIGRELKMIELKKEIELLRKAP